MQTPPHRTLTTPCLIALAIALTVVGCAPATNTPGTTTMHNTPANTTPETSDPARPFGGTRPAKEVFTDFLDTIDDIVKHSGTTFPGWDRNRLVGYHGEACGINTREDGAQYTVAGEGGAIADPKAAVEKTKNYLESQGYTIGNIFDDSETTKGKGVDLNATSPTGIYVGFSASTLGSSINVQSDCTLDPAAKKLTTDNFPLHQPTA